MGLCHCTELTTNVANVHPFYLYVSLIKQCYTLVKDLVCGIKPMPSWWNGLHIEKLTCKEYSGKGFGIKRLNHLSNLYPHVRSSFIHSYIHSFMWEVSQLMILHFYKIQIGVEVFDNVTVFFILFQYTTSVDESNDRDRVAQPKNRWGRREKDRWGVKK